MEILEETLRHVHYWANSRINSLTVSAMDMKDPENIEDAYAIQCEFKEWLDPESGEDHDIFSMEYIGEGSEYE